MKKITHLEFVKRVKLIHGNDIEILSEYVNKRTKVKVKHKCGFIWETNPETLCKGHSCPKCSNNIKKTTENFKKEVYDIVGNEYEVIGEYKNTHSKIKFKHNKCGNIFEMEPNAFLSGQRCPNERYIKSALNNSISLEEINLKIKKVTNNEYIIVDNYKNATSECSILHKKCNRIFKGLPTRLINDLIGCPYCQKSKGEIILQNILEENNINFESQYRIKECKNKRPLPFDFAIFKNNNLKYLIEYDGIQHFKPKWGNERFLETRKNDEIKNKYCKENGIKLIRIKYIRTENYEKLKNYIMNELIDSKII